MIDIKVKGGLGSILVLAVEKDTRFEIAEMVCVSVDGKKVKADTWYTISAGELVEVTA